jgi:hypothetical protein
MAITSWRGESVMEGRIGTLNLLCGEPHLWMHAETNTFEYDFNLT